MQLIKEKMMKQKNKPIKKTSKVTEPVEKKEPKVKEPGPVVLQNLRIYQVELPHDSVIMVEIDSESIALSDEQGGDENWISNSSYLARMKSYADRVEKYLTEKFGNSTPIIVSIRNRENKIYD